MARGQWIYTNPRPWNPACPGCLGEARDIKGERSGNIYIHNPLFLRVSSQRREQGLGMLRMDHLGQEAERC